MYDGFGVDQLTHGLQTATRAERAGADDELVVASLCHDIGKAVCVPNHPRIAAEILRPYVRPEVTAAIAAHQDFQGRHYYHHFSLDPDMRDRYRDEPWFELAERFADEWDQNSFDPDYPTEPLVPFRAQGAGHLRQPAHLLMSPTQRHRWLTRPDSRGQKRVAALQTFTLDSARQDFEDRYPQVRFGPIVGLIAAYNEEKNIGDVLKAMPTMVGDLEVTTLVVVDGGTDNTAGVALDAGVLTCILPVNLGQGAALKLGYELAAAHGARYVVTLDADGQNDPSELPSMVQPLLDDTSDFVIASRRLGVDQHHRPVPAGRGEALRVDPQRDLAPGADRLLQRLPRLQDRAAQRHRPPSDPGPVPDGRGGDHRVEPGVADHPAAHRVASPGLGHVEEGRQPGVRAAVRPG